MVKISGLSKCNKKDINMFGEKSFKKHLGLNLEGSLKKIESITTAAEIIKVELQKVPKGKMEESSIIVFFRIQFKMVYSLKGSLDLRIYTLVFIEEIEILIPRELFLQLSEYTYIDGNENCEIYVERVKAEVEREATVSLAFYVTATGSFTKLNTLHFKAAFSTGEENIFTLNFSEGVLRQRTFFFDNSIDAFSIKGKEGFLSVKEKEENLYFLGSDVLEKIITLEKPGKILSILKINGDRLLIRAEREGMVNVYLYNEGFFDLILKDIYTHIAPIYAATSKELYYGKVCEDGVAIMKKSLKEEEEDHLILKTQKPCSYLVLSKNEKLGALIINKRDILIFGLDGKIKSFIRGDKEETLKGTIEELAFTRDEQVLFLKTKDNNRYYLYQLFVLREVFRCVVTPQEALELHDFTGTFHDSHLYISTNRREGASIYSMNLKTLEKELLLELNSNKIEFLNK